MLSDTSAIATVAVASLDKAKQFYEERLGLDDPDGNIFSLVIPPTTAKRETVSASGRSKA